MLGRLRSLVAQIGPNKSTNMNSTLEQMLAEHKARKQAVHPWTRGQPHAQPHYVYAPEEKRWRGIVAGSKSSAIDNNTATPEEEVKAFTILSWNIDFMRPLTQQRMLAALKHLHSLVTQSKTPCVILLQEMLVSDLEIMQSQSWIQEGYHLTDIDKEHWESFYGTCTMVPKSLSIVSVFRVHYEQTNMERDGLFTDIAVTNGRTLRICNTHLESLVANPPLRPSQLQSAASFMHQPEVHASVLGGDLNAIESFDKTLHADNNLLDAYLETGGTEDTDSSCTWGQMADTKSRDRFGLSRMDKLLFCGKIQVERFETFGYGVQVELEQDRQKLIHTGLEAGWVTDHLGVRGDFRIVEESSR